MQPIELDGRHLDVADLEVSAALLSQWATAHYGAGAAVERVRPMPGHAGISFGFDVVTPAGVEPLVIRVAPPGLKRSGPGDVLHQVPVLRAAKLQGVPVPEVRWWSDDERWFGCPYFVVERLPGTSTLNVWEPTVAGAETVQPIFEQAAAALAGIHDIDWRRRLPNWSVPRTLADEVAAWQPILLKGRNDEWTERAMVLHDLLLRQMPAEPEPAVVHGDYYSNNWVCAGNNLLAVVDWEISCVGPPLLDVGWLMMIYDPASWGPVRRAWMDWSPEPQSIAEAYAGVTGRQPADLAWYRALAAWRLGSITALNVRVHRSGRRPDETWEIVADAFESMVDRGCELLLSTAAAR